MAGEGVVGLKELGAREMSYRLMFVACSTKVCVGGGGGGGWGAHRLPDCMWQLELGLVWEVTVF
jgi:hypothetical protein